MTEQKNAAHRKVVEYFKSSIPFNASLGIEVVETEHRAALTRLPFKPHFIGDVDAGLWHSSVLDGLIDAAGGLCVQLALPQLEPIATLDLRTDYLRPAVAGEPVFARAECYHVTRYIAFMRAEMYQTSRDRLTAHCTATFMRTSRGRRTQKSQ